MKSLIAILLVFLTAGNILSQSWIVSTSPAKYQLNVSKNQNIQVNFSRQISQVSINSNNIKLYGNIQGYIPCVLTYTPSQKKLVISHTKSFMPGENIYVIITHNLRDSANITMGKIYSTMFTTQAIGGSGTFTQINTPIPAGSTPYYGTCADFNNDSKPDIAVTNYYSGSISVMKNYGGMNFTSQLISGYTNQAGIVSGDVDCDGDIDIITTLETLNGVVVYLNNGSGMFSGLPYFMTGIHPLALAAGFIDSDEYLDIITASWDVSYPDIRVFRGNGNGTFSLKNVYTSGIRPLCIYIGDIDNDGDNDVGVGIDYSNPRVEFYLNDGTGNLTYNSNAGTLDRPYGIAGNDLNGDGFVDIAVTNKYMNSLSILINSGNGSFTNYIYPVLGNYPYGITLNDFNKDGKIDIATALQNSSMIDVKLNTGTLPLFTSHSYNNLFGISTNLVSSDFDNDNDIDIAVIDHNSNSVCIYKNTDSVSISVNPVSSEIPSEYKLWQNYPNPFNPATKIRFSVIKADAGIRNSVISIRVYNVLGCLVKTLINEPLSPGTYEVTFDAGNLPSGTYYYVMTAENFSQSKKLILLK